MDLAESNPSYAKELSLNGIWEGPASQCGEFVAHSIRRLQEFTEKDGSWDDLRYRSKTHAKSIALALRDCGYIRGFLTQECKSTADMNEDTFIVQYVTADDGEIIDLHEACTALKLIEFQTTLFSEVSHILYNPDRIVRNGDRPDVHVARGNLSRRDRKLRLAAINRDMKERAIGELLPMLSGDDAIRVVALSLRRFGLPCILTTTPEQVMYLVIRTILSSREEPGCINFGGLGIQNSSRLCTSGFCQQSGRSEMIADLTVANALWIDRRTCTRDDERMLVLTRRFYSFLADMSHLKELKLSDVNLYETTRHIKKPATRGRITAPDAGAPSSSGSPNIHNVKIPTASFTNLQRLSICFTSWSRNRGWPHYHRAIAWMLPLPSLQSLTLPAPGNIQRRHAGALYRLLRDLSEHLTELQFQLPPARQCYEPCAEELQARLDLLREGDDVEDPKLTARARKRRRKRKRKALKAAQAVKNSNAPYVSVWKGLQQAEMWGIQTRGLAKLVRLKVWDSHSLPLLRCPWAPRLTSLELSVRGLKWEILAHSTVISLMTELKECTLHIGEFCLPPDPPSSRACDAGHEELEDVHVRACTSTSDGDDDSLSFGDSHSDTSSTIAQNTAPMPQPTGIPRPVPTRVKDRTTPPLTNPRDACAWCQLGQTALGAFTGLTSLTRLKFHFHGGGECCVYDCQCLSKLSSLRSFDLDIVCSSLLWDVEEWRKEGGNMMLPVWPKLQRLCVHAPVPAHEDDQYMQVIHAMPILSNVMKGLTGHDTATMTSLNIADYRWTQYGETNLGPHLRLQHHAVFKSAAPYILNLSRLTSLQVPGGSLFDTVEFFANPVQSAHAWPDALSQLRTLQGLIVPDLSESDVRENAKRRQRREDPGSISDKLMLLLEPDVMHTTYLPTTLTELSLSLGRHAPVEMGFAIGELTALRKLSIKFRRKFNSPDNIAPYCAAIGRLSRLTTLCYMSGVVSRGDSHMHIDAYDIEELVLRPLGESLTQLNTFGQLRQLYIWELRIIGRDGGFCASIARLTSLNVLSFLGCQFQMQSLENIIRVFRGGEKMNVRKLHLFTISPTGYTWVNLREFLKGFPLLSQVTFRVGDVGDVNIKEYRKFGHVQERDRKKRIIERLIKNIKADIEMAGVHAANIGYGMDRNAYMGRLHAPDWDPVTDLNMLDDVCKASDAIIRGDLPEDVVNKMDWTYDDS